MSSDRCDPIKRSRLYIYIYIYIYIYKRASLAYAARLADTVFAGCALWAPGLTLMNYKVDNISKYVCPTVIIDIASFFDDGYICE